ncbi:MAG: (d)CMP kinase [Verrucomicrobia bacterium]|nr:(d)CMP kinase [Verrucomicrobiota bacterium]
MIVTIDGPAGTGKTTLAKNVAKALHLPYFDTGAMYRSVTYLLLQHKIALSDLKQISELLKSFTFEIKLRRDEVHYFASGIDVTKEIRSQAVNQFVSPVSALPIVREAILKIQRKFVTKKGGVFEGRDMGTTVFPHAEYKIFLTARPDVRAQRRLDEMLQKRPHEAEGLSREALLKQLQQRDEYDSKRTLSPLRQPLDSYVIDTSDLTIKEVTDRILEYIAKKSSRPPWTRLHVKFLYRIIIFLAWSFCKIFYRHKIYGLEHYYPRGAILAANHASFLDPPLVSISWPEEVHFLARGTLFKNKIFGKFISALNAHPVSGGASDIGVLKTIFGLLKEGKKVILFPEGTRSVDGELQPIKPGIGLILERTKAAVVPVYIHGSSRVWGKRRKLPKLWGKTTCVFGSPIRWESFEHLESKKAKEAVAEALTDALEALKAWLKAGARGIPP